MKTIERIICEEALVSVGVLPQTAFNDKRKNGRRIKFSGIRLVGKNSDKLARVKKYLKAKHPTLNIAVGHSEPNNWSYYDGVTFTFKN